MRVTDFANELFGADPIPERGAELGREADSAWLGAGAEAPLNADEILDHIAVMLRPDRNPEHEAQVSDATNRLALSKHAEDSGFVRLILS